MATPNYDINYDDERFGKVESDYQQELTDIEQAYGGMIDSTDKYYDDLIQASKDNAASQTEIQNQQTQFTIDQINQQKDQAKKDYVKQQSGAYIDWQKQSNQYGANAEKMASSGMTGTGYSESSQVSMYNTYQNRVATARASFDQAVLNYNNSITNAQLQNSSILAEIAANAFKEQAQLALEGFQYKNNLILDQANKKTEAANNRWNRYLAVLNQINTENALAENVRQFEENLKFSEHQAELDREFKAAQAELDRNFQEAQNELNRKHDFDMLNAKTEKEKELLEEQHKKDMEKLKQQHEYDLELLKKQKSYSSGGGSNKKGNVVVTGNETTVTGNGGYDENGIHYGMYDKFDEMVARGDTKAQVVAEIDKERKNGKLTTAQANKLKKIYNPKGYTY